jgi:multidrug efflux pump subunit AcrB
MTTVDAMIRRLGAGDSKQEAATFAYRSLAAPMLTGTLVTIAGFVPIGFASSGAASTPSPSSPWWPSRSSSPGSSR